MIAVINQTLSSLNEKDLRLLDYIDSTQKKTGYPPSIRQMIAFRECTGENPITKSLNKFRTRGLVDWTKEREYLQKTTANIPIVGKIDNNGDVIFGNLNTDKCLDISMVWIDRFFALEIETRSNSQSSTNVSTNYIIFERHSHRKTSEGCQLRQINGKTKIAKSRSLSESEIARTVGSWEKIDA